MRNKNKILLLIFLSLIISGCSLPKKKEYPKQETINIEILLKDAEILFNQDENELAIKLCKYILEHSNDTNTYIKLFDYSVDKDAAITLILELIAGEKTEDNENIIFHIGNYYLSINDYANAYYYFSMIQNINEIEQYKEIARILLIDHNSKDIETNLNNLLESIDKMEISKDKIKYYETLYALFISLDIKQDIAIKILDKITITAKELYNSNENNEFEHYPLIELEVANIYYELASNNSELYKNALAGYQAYILINEEDKIIGLRIARILRILEYNDQAIIKYEELIESYPDDISIQCIYAEMLLDIEFNKVDRTMRDFSKILGIYINLKLKENRYEWNEFINLENRLLNQNLIDI